MREWHVRRQEQPSELLASDIREASLGELGFISALALSLVGPRDDLLKPSSHFTMGHMHPCAGGP